MDEQRELLDPSYLDLCKRSPRCAYVSELFYDHEKIFRYRP